MRLTISKSLICLVLVLLPQISQAQQPKYEANVLDAVTTPDIVQTRIQHALVESEAEGVHSGFLHAHEIAMHGGGWNSDEKRLDTMVKVEIVVDFLNGFGAWCTVHKT